MNTKYDIHCHIFNKHVLTRNLFGVLTAALELTKIKAKAAFLEKLDHLAATLDFLNTATFDDIYHHIETIYGDDFALTPLMMDLTFADDSDGTHTEIKRYRRRIEFLFKIIKVTIREIMDQTGDKGTRKKLKNLSLKLKQFYKNFDVNDDGNVEIFSDHNYKEQLVKLNELAEKYPEKVLPFYCVDPRQERENKIDTIQALKDNLKPKGNFAGVKLYTPLGYSPLDPILMGTDKKIGVYQYCIENNIPITVHNSNAGFACFSKELKVFGEVNLDKDIDSVNGTTIDFKKQFFGLEAAKAIEERAHVLNHPKLWAKVLEKYPALKINLAHFGGSSQIMDYVDYAFRKKTYHNQEFDAAIATLPESNRTLVSKYFKNRKIRMVLDCEKIKNIKKQDRAKLWNSLNQAGLIDNWAKAIFDIIKKPEYPNVYTDISCFAEYNYDADAVQDVCNPKKKKSDNDIRSIKTALKKFISQFYNKLSEYEKSKIMYGSDYFLIEFQGVKMQQYVRDFKSAFGKKFDEIASKHPNSFMNDFKKAD